MTMTMFESDVQSVRLFQKYSYEMLLLLDDCSVNGRLIKVAQFINQSFFQMVNVTNLVTIHSLLQNAWSTGNTNHLQLDQ